VSVAEAAHRPANTGRAMRLWLALIVLIGAGIGLAWLGAGSLRPVVSESGLQFRTIKNGTGEPIGPADSAYLDYILSANDGTVADASDAHGGPTQFTMAGVYPGFAEAMTHMHDGGQYRFTIPQSIAWGAGQSPPGWPKDSPLTFDVRVRKVVRGGAAEMQSGLPPQP
jgi:FKBP-type peptidyl-prolyl cis-trans isomerase FkpA